MRTGVIGDIHANLAAFEAVLACLESEGVDFIICTGDIVGYGPSPKECIRIMREREIPTVLGNHDHYVTLLMDPRLDKLDPDTRSVIEWTQGQLDMDELRWVAQLPLKLEYEPFTVIHGSLAPKHWTYLVNERAIAEHFQYQNTPLGFGGHSHLPVVGVQVPGHTPEVTFLRNMLLPVQDCKVLVNVGSVGQPRDVDPRAACGIYDDADQRIIPLRVEYDIAATQALMRQAGLPERFAVRLELGK